MAVGRQSPDGGVSKPPAFWKQLGTVREAVQTIVGDHYGLYGRVLRDNLALEEDLGSDRLDKLEILMTMEELFGVYFEESVPESVVTIGDLVAAVEDALRKPSSVRNLCDGATFSYV